jgi:hypothetical protein
MREREVGMICESCKKSIPETAGFCPGCGIKIEKPEPVQAADVAAETVGGPAPVAAPEPEKESPVTAADKPKSNNALLWIIVIIVLLGAGAAGGYVFYTTFFLNKETPKSDSQSVPGVPDQGQVLPSPGGQGGQMQPGGPSEPSMQPQPSPMPPMQPPAQVQQQTASQLLTKVEIKASALVSDIKNGKPAGFSSSFLIGSSRVAHYVQYQKAQPGQTIFASVFYKDGVAIFKCGPKPLQYPTGNYFCRAAQNLDEGNYEVRFIVDGVESQILRFKVAY